MTKYWQRMGVNSTYKAFLLLLVLICLFRLLPSDDFPVKVISQTNQNCPQDAADLGEFKVTYVKKFKSGDDKGKYDLYFISFPEMAYSEKCIEFTRKILNERIKKRRSKVFLFDDAKQAKLFSKGKGHFQGMDSVIRGLYYFEPEVEEYIKFSPKKGERWDAITITIK